LGEPFADPKDQHRPARVVDAFGDLPRDALAVFPVSRLYVDNQ